MQILKIIFYTVASSFIIWLINVSKTGGPHGPYELFSIDFTNTTVVYPVVDDIAESIPIYSAMLNTLTTWTKEVFSRKRFSLKSISLHESGDDHFMFLIEVYSNAKYEQNYSTISSYLNSELVLEVQKYVDVQPPLGWCLSRRQTVIENANVTVQVEWKKYFNNSQFSMHDCFQPWLKRNPEQHASLSRKSRIPHGPYQLFAIDFTNTTTIYATMNKTEEMEQL